jgi:hypothetical protein
MPRLEEEPVYSSELEEWLLEEEDPSDIPDLEEDPFALPDLEEDPFDPFALPDLEEEEDELELWEEEEGELWLSEEEPVTEDEEEVEWDELDEEEPPFPFPPFPFPLLPFPLLPFPLLPFPLLPFPDDVRSRWRMRPFSLGFNWRSRPPLSSRCCWPTFSTSWAKALLTKAKKNKMDATEAFMTQDIWRGRRDTT